MFYENKAQLKALDMILKIPQNSSTSRKFIPGVTNQQIALQEDFVIDDTTKDLLVRFMEKAGFTHPNKAIKWLIAKTEDIWIKIRVSRCVK